MVGPAGMLADARGLPTALGCLASLLGVGLGCAWALPDVRRARAPVDFVQPVVAVEETP